MNTQSDESLKEPNSAMTGDADIVSERHRCWLRRVWWTGGLLVVIVLLCVIAYQMSVTWTLRQHGWDLRHVYGLPEWIPSSVGTRFAPIDYAMLADRPGPRSGDLELLQQYSQLSILVFNSTQLSESSLEAIGNIKTLRYFSLMSSNVEEEGLRYLNSIPEMQEVGFVRMPVGDVAMRHIANCRWLWRVHFVECHMNDASLAYFSKCTDLEELTFRDTNVGDRGIELLSTCPELEILRLEGTHVTDDGIVHLAKCPRLRFLEVAKMPINNAAIQRFVMIRTDVRLRLLSTNVTQDAVDELKRKHPGLEIELLK